MAEYRQKVILGAAFRLRFIEGPGVQEHLRFHLIGPLPKGFVLRVTLLTDCFKRTKSVTSSTR